jgi:biopolymer transport protein ExbB
MRALLTFIIVCLFAVSVQADELENAYQKEYAYLVAEKQALEKRLENLKANNRQSLNRISSDVEQLQTQYLSKQNQVDRLNQQIRESSRDADFTDDDALLLKTTLLQARESLKKSDIEIDESKEQDQQLDAAFSKANQLIQRDGQVFTTSGSFFSRQGELTEGEIIHAGRIARYGVAERSAGALRRRLGCWRTTNGLTFWTSCCSTTPVKPWKSRMRKASAKNWKPVA